MRSPKQRLISIVAVLSFAASLVAPVPSRAELLLPAPGTLVSLSVAADLPILKGLKVHADNPLKFEFILDNGRETGETALKEQSSKLIKYFLASLTTPEQEMWVNLSPYEKDRIVPESFGQTEMGRDLLAQDYLLKQITASLVYPEGDLGKQFWKRVYELTANKNVPINTFNKVWIVPDKAVVYENAKSGTAYVVESSLKVMTEQDYLATSKHEATGPAAASPVSSSRHPSPSDTPSGGRNPDFNKSFLETVGTRGVAEEKTTFPLALRSKQADASSPVAGTAQIVRDIVIPQLTKDVNMGANFAQLRQVYNSLILATWYKKKIKGSILSEVYADKNKVDGIKINDPKEKERIYAQYLEAFKKGAYNFIKEERDSLSGQVVPRKYFSGGVKFGNIDLQDTSVPPKVDTAMLSIVQAFLTDDFSVSDEGPAKYSNGPYLGAYVGHPNVKKALGRRGVDPKNKEMHIVLIGPDGQAGDLDAVLTLFPLAKRVDVIDKRDIAPSIAKVTERHDNPPQVVFHHQSITDPLTGITGADLVLAFNVFDANHFSKAGLEKAAKNIHEMMNNHGVFLMNNNDNASTYVSVDLPIYSANWLPQELFQQEYLGVYRDGRGVTIAEKIKDKAQTSDDKTAENKDGSPLYGGKGSFTLFDYMGPDERSLHSYLKAVGFNMAEQGKGRKIVLIGPGGGAIDLKGAIKLFPEADQIDVIDKEDIRAAVDQVIAQNPGLKPRIIVHQQNIVEPFSQVQGADLVLSTGVSDATYFSAENLAKAAENIHAMMKHGGIFIMNDNANVRFKDERWPIYDSKWLPRDKFSQEFIELTKVNSGQGLIVARANKSGAVSGGLGAAILPFTKKTIPDLPPLVLDGGAVKQTTFSDVLEQLNDQGPAAQRIWEIKDFADVLNNPQRLKSLVELQEKGMVDVLIFYTSEGRWLLCAAADQQGISIKPIKELLQPRKTRILMRPFSPLKYKGTRWSKAEEYPLFAYLDLYQSLEVKGIQLSPTGITLTSFPAKEEQVRPNMSYEDAFKRWIWDVYRKDDAYWLPVFGLKSAYVGFMADMNIKNEVVPWEDQEGIRDVLSRVINQAMSSKPQGVDRALRMRADARLMKRPQQDLIRNGINLKEYGNEADVVYYAARRMADVLIANNALKLSTRMITPTGGTYEPVYAQFVRIVKEEGIDCSHLITYNMDEYYVGKEGADGRWKHHPQSYRQFMEKYLYAPLREADSGWKDANGHVLNGNAADIDAEVKIYEQAVREGGIDIALGGIGRDGHIAFNEPIITLSVLGSIEVEKARDFNEFLLDIPKEKQLDALEEVLTKHWAARRSSAFEEYLKTNLIVPNFSRTSPDDLTVFIERLLRQPIVIYFKHLDGDFKKVLEKRAAVLASMMGGGSVIVQELKDPADIPTRMVHLALPTLFDNSRFLAKDIKSIRDIPLSALTVGPGTLRQAKEIVVAATGEKKASAVTDAVMRKQNPAVSASLLQGHRHVTFIIDEDVARSSTLLQEAYAKEEKSLDDPRSLPPSADAAMRAGEISARDRADKALYQALEGALFEPANMELQVKGFGRVPLRFSKARFHMPGPIFADEYPLDVVVSPKESYSQEKVRNDMLPPMDFLFDGKDPGAFYPPKGSFGQIGISLVSLDHSTALLINYNQASNGLRSSGKDGRPFIGWVEAAHEHIIEVARSVGIQQIYALPSKAASKLYYGLESADAVNLAYEKPYQNKERWKEVVVDEELAKKIKVGFNDHEQPFLWKYDLGTLKETPERINEDGVLADRLRGMFELDSDGRMSFASGFNGLPLLFDLYYVRHGQTQGNLEGILQGQQETANSQLTDEGISQAKQAAVKLFDQLGLATSKPSRPLVIVTSQLNRTKETAGFFVQMLKDHGVPFEIVYDQLQRLINELNVGAMGNKKELTPREQDLLNRYMGANAKEKFPLGESFVDLLLRARQWLLEMNEQYQGRTVVVFGHGNQSGALRSLLGDRTILNLQGTVDWINNKLPNALPVQLSSGFKADAAMRAEDIFDFDKDELKVVVLERQLQEVMLKVNNGGRAIIVGGTRYFNSGQRKDVDVLLKGMDMFSQGGSFVAALKEMLLAYEGVRIDDVIDLRKRRVIIKLTLFGENHQSRSLSIDLIGFFDGDDAALIRRLKEVAVNGFRMHIANAEYEDKFNELAVKDYFEVEYYLGDRQVYEQMLGKFKDPVLTGEFYKPDGLMATRMMELRSKVQGLSDQQIAEAVDAKLAISAVQNRQLDEAMLSSNNQVFNRVKGGIDLNADKMDLQTRNGGQILEFKVDPALLKRLENASGFAPVIINIRPLRDLNVFLGVSG